MQKLHSFLKAVDKIFQFKKNSSYFKDEDVKNVDKRNNILVSNKVKTNKKLLNICVCKKLLFRDMFISPLNVNS